MTQESIKLLQKLEHLVDGNESAQDVIKKIITLEKLASVKPAKFDCKKLLKFCKDYWCDGILYENKNAVVTNSHFISVVKTDYPTEFEGKIITKDGKEINRTFPPYKTVIDKLKKSATETSTVYLQNITLALEAVKTYEKFHIGKEIHSIEIGPKVYTSPQNAKILLDFHKTYNIDQIHIERGILNSTVGSFFYAEATEALLVLAGVLVTDDNMEYCYRA